MKNLILAAFFALPFLTAQAQEAPKLYTLPSPYERYTHYLATVRLTGAMPVGSFANLYIDKASIKNYSISLEWVFRNAISVGGEIGSSYFQKRLPRAIYQSGEQTLSAVQTRTFSQTPIQAFVNYHFLPKASTIQPYVQLSGGVSIVDYSLYYGSLVEQRQKTAPAYGVGLGSKFLFKRDGSFGADVRVKYQATTFKYDYVEKGAASVNGSIGIFYRWW